MFHHHLKGRVHITPGERACFNVTGFAVSGEIGSLCSRHHTTALPACRAVAARLEGDPALRSELRDLEKELFGDPSARPDANHGP